MLIFLSVLLALAAIGLLVHRNGLTLSGPYLVPAALLALMIVLGTFLYPSVQAVGPRYIAGQIYDARYGTILLTVGLAAFCVGCTLGLGRSRRDDLVVRLEVQSARRRQLIVRVAIGIAVLAVVTYLVAIGGPAGFLERPGYLQYDGPAGLLSVGNGLILIAPAVLGYAYAAPESKRSHPAMLLLLLVLLLLTFSTASRRLGLVPAFFWIGLVLYLPTKRRLLLGIPVIALTLTLSGAALSFRELSRSGFLPYAQQFIAHPGASFTSGASSVSNALAPFAYNALSAREPSIPTNDIIQSITPLPSQFTTIYTLFGDMQFFSHHPWPSLGTLANWGGLAPAAAYMLFAGAVLGFAGRTALRLNPRAVPVAAILILAVGSYFMLKCLSYSLRTSSRIIWYLLLACLLLRLVYLPIREYRHRQQEMMADLGRLRRDLDDIKVPATPGRRSVPGIAGGRT